MNVNDVLALHAKAHAAGMIAGNLCIPNPMIVSDGNHRLDYVSEGLCGFAWIHFKGNTTFGRLMKKAGLAREDYPKGLCVWVSDFNQSVTRKEAYARAYAKVLNEAGITDAYSASRLD